MQEIWKPVSGFESSYEVSNHGRVRSLDRIIQHKNGTATQRKGRMLIQCLRAGYPFVHLRNDGINKQVHTHRLVAQEFCDKPEGCDVVNHLDGDKEKCHYSNLEWTTHKGNAIHAVRHGLSKPARGEDSGNAFLTEKQVCDIRLRVIGGESVSVLAKAYGVHVMAISDIRRGRSWNDPKHKALIHICKNTPACTNEGSKSPNAKLNEGDVREIIKLLKQRSLQKDIAELFGCQRTTISYINHGTQWGHVRVEGHGEPPYYVAKPRAKHIQKMIEQGRVI